MRDEKNTGPIYIELYKSIKWLIVWIHIKKYAFSVMLEDNEKLFVYIKFWVVKEVGRALRECVVYLNNAKLQV